MPRRSAAKAYANFTGGLVTEANKLSYPENAAIDIDNLDINEDGSVQRRAGLAFDGTITDPLKETSIPLATTATTLHKWSSVNGDPDKTIAVVQNADRLEFFYVRDEELLSNTPAAAAIFLTEPSRPSASTLILREGGDITTVSGGGRLYVAGKYIDPFSLEFVPPATEWETGTLVKTNLILKIRDFDIAKEDETFGSGASIYKIDGGSRQDYMSGAHFYNLANQGWPHQETDITVSPYGVLKQIRETTAKVSAASNPDSGTSDSDPAEYTYTRTGLGFFPTTQDLFHSYQAGGGDTISEQIAYSPWMLENDYTGTTESPRGKFIKEAFFIDRQATGKYGSAASTGNFLSNYTYSEQLVSQYRPSTVAFYAGRAWYAGLEGSRYTNNLYYSQVIGDRIANASKCYQDSDPTAEVINELVATDGGVLGLEEVGKIYKMAPIGPSLAIIADNGVWVVSGEGEYTSFRADAFSVRKVTDQGAINVESIVFAKNTIYYWGETSLVALLTGESGAVAAQDISSRAIKDLYQETSIYVKQSAFSVFDEGANRVLWFYSSGLNSSYTTLSGKAFNKVLYFDVSLNAFGKYTLSISPELFVVAGMNSKVYNQLSIEDPVIDSGVQVTASGDLVTTTTEIFVPETSSIKLLTLQSTGTGSYAYRFSGFADVSTYADWGTDYKSYIEGGFDSLEDVISKSKKANLLQTHFERTENGFTQPDEVTGEVDYLNKSGCLVSHRWDWGESFSSNQFQAYKLLKNYTPEDSLDLFSYDRSIISTRNRLRGRGTSLGLRFESEAGKDMRLLGYGIIYSNRDRP